MITRHDANRGGRAGCLASSLITQFLHADFVIGVELLGRSEEHTSELQSRVDLVCRLLLEKKKDIEIDTRTTPERRMDRAQRGIETRAHGSAGDSVSRESDGVEPRARNAERVGAVLARAHT